MKKRSAIVIKCVPLPSTDPLLRSKPTMLELLDHVVLRVAARWYHFGLALGVEDYLLEDIKATERGEVEACCADMLKSWPEGSGPQEGRSVAGLLCWEQCRGASDGRQLHTLLEHCSQHSELCASSVGKWNGMGNLILSFSLGHPPTHHDDTPPDHTL